MRPVGNSIDIDPLPIDTVRDPFERVLNLGRVVVSAPTGSGKSTQVPRWCKAKGPVLVVEPRRVACRSLAARVAQLEGVALGESVGYSVRDDHRVSPNTEILFATPGVVLRKMGDGGLKAYRTIILDEFHERGLDVDLILALLLAREPDSALIVMSATLDGNRVASHIQGTHIQGEGRVYPVEQRYIANEDKIPADRDLEARILAAIGASRGLPGDILVFLPGKAEIARAAETLRGQRDLEILSLHGGLTLDEQSRVFAGHQQRRVVLATNVAETSLTIPGIGVVIDSGLVRRTAYHNGRGFLTLVPIAGDSAEQRAGRAGRTAPGVCFRLWSREACLAPQTPPEIHRESLVPLVLAAAACEATKPEDLPFLDPPKLHALETAREELEGLGAINKEGALTPRGRTLFGLPLDAALGSLLISAETRGCLEDVIDLVSVLAVGRPLYRGGPPDIRNEEDLREGGCDATAHIRALRKGKAAQDRLDPYTLTEARSISARLRRAYNLPARSDPKAGIDRRRLAFVFLEADPRCAHVARKRGKRVAWSNGGTEIELSRDSAVNLIHPEAIAVLGTQAVGLGYRDRRIFATCATPLVLDWMVEAGLGREKLGTLSLEEGTVLARVERVYARKVLASREMVPEGGLAREAIATLFVDGRIFKDVREEAEDRLESWRLFVRLSARGKLDGSQSVSGWDEEITPPWEGPAPDLEAWTCIRLSELGVESGEDLRLLTGEDLLPPELPEMAKRSLDREFPRQISLGDAVYRLNYDLERQEVTLDKVRGTRREPPALSFLPAFRGLRILVADRGRVVVLRERA